MKSDYTTNSCYITHTIAFWKVGRIHFLSSGVKGLKVTSWPDRCPSRLCSQTHILASTGSDRSIVLYDMRGSAPLRKVVMAMRSNTVAWNPLEAFVFTVANEDSNLYTYDMRRMDHPVNVHKDHVSAVLDVDYAPTGQEFVSGSFDRTIRIFQRDSGHSRWEYAPHVFATPYYSSFCGALRSWSSTCLPRPLRSTWLCFCEALQFFAMPSYGSLFRASRLLEQHVFTTPSSEHVAYFLGGSKSQSEKTTRHCCAHVFATPCFVFPFQGGLPHPAHAARVLRSVQRRLRLCPVRKWRNQHQVPTLPPWLKFPPLNLRRLQGRTVTWWSYRDNADFATIINHETPGKVVSSISTKQSISWKVFRLFFHRKMAEALRFYIFKLDRLYVYLQTK